MISYAQNFEDVMLWRALKQVEKGFYIDVGAAWPEEHSITKFFYDNGWNGINIEPNPQLFSLLAKERTRDLNLQMAIGEQNELSHMTFFESTGLSTMEDSIAAEHLKSGWSGVKQQVTVTTLASICEKHVLEGQEIHFLKIDAEGFEKQVLDGADFSAYRPWILVVEATHPLSQKMSFDQWELIIAKANYQFVYADGLNRFYISKEHTELLQNFNYPPNVFDGFVLNAQIKAENITKEVKERLGTSETRLALTEERATQLSIQNTALLTSTSWKITKPVRLFKDFLSWFKMGLISWVTLKPGSRPHRIMRGSISRLKNWVLSHPRISRLVRSLIFRYPKLFQKLRQINHSRITQSGVKIFTYNSETDLPPYAQNVYERLATAIAHRNNAKEYK